MARLRATMKKYGLDAERLWTEYDKRYLAAHGVDLAKIKAELRRRGRERMERRLKGHPAERAEVEKYIKEHPEDADQFLLPPEPGEEPGPSLPELDDELLDMVIPTLITDRSAFYEAASEIFTPKTKGKSGDDDVFGNLKGLRVTGDTAKGWIAWSRSHVEKGTRDVYEPVRVLRKFRRLGGRWYNDDTGDLAHFDDAEAGGGAKRPREKPGGPEPGRP
jgi:hypothetical protein